MKIKKITDGRYAHTWDIEVPDVCEYLLSNGCVSHNTSGKAVNATESTEPINEFFYKEEGTMTIPTLVSNFRLNNQYYKPAFDCNMFKLIENAAVRQKWLDQAQSINVYIKKPDSLDEMTKIHLYGFFLGIRTFYYLKQQKSGADEVACESCS